MPMFWNSFHAELESRNRSLFFSNWKTIRIGKVRDPLKVPCNHPRSSHDHISLQFIHYISCLHLYRIIVAMSANIPVVSFAPFLSGNKEERQKVARQVYDAFSTVGFIYLKDHGISQSDVEQVFREVSLSRITWPFSAPFLVES